MTIFTLKMLYVILTDCIQNRHLKLHMEAVGREIMYITMNRTHSDTNKFKWATTFSHYVGHCRNAKKTNHCNFRPAPRAFKFSVMARFFGARWECVMCLYSVDPWSYQKICVQVRNFRFTIYLDEEAILNALLNFSNS